MANLQHRLAALWFADIVGFSQLSHEDESGALEVVQLFQSIARDTVDRYGGHVVKFVGDAALAEFHSTEAAIRAACRLRSSFFEQTKANDLGERDLHIGVHVGEIATTPDGDVYGDGVNATARIMNQAEPGQVLASEDVWHQLRQRKEFQFEALGEHDLRGAGLRVLHSVHVKDETSTEWPEVREEAPASKLGTLYDELKRRRVFRVAVAYAVAAWLVTQIADTVVPAMFLPVWITRAVILFAILGFPVAIVLAWAYDITREGLKRTLPVGADANLRTRGFPHVQKVAAGLVIAAVVVGGWAGWNRWSLGPPTISASTVAILPFNVRASETFQYLGEGMASLIATKMSGVEEYHSVDPHAVLKFVKRTGVRNIDPQSGQTVAEHFGAGLYVIGDVVELGDQIHLNIRIYESDRQEPTTQISVQGDADNLTGLVDQIVGMMLAAQFGETELQLTTLSAMTSDSLEAIKAFLEGDREYRAGSYTTAVEAFQRAVAIDSLFALAYYRLGISAFWIPEWDLADEAAERALQYSARLSPPHRTLVEAFHAQLNSHPLQVKELLRPYLDVHPDDIDALYIYGEALFHYNNLVGRLPSEGRQHYERAFRLDPTNSAIASHLMDIAAGEEQFATIDSLLQQVNAGQDLRLRWRALLAFAGGDSIDQRQAINELRSVSDDQVNLAVHKLALYSPGSRGAEQAATLLLASHRSQSMQKVGRLWLINLYLKGGRWQEAHAELEALEQVDPVKALEFQAFYAAVPFLGAAENELRNLRAEVIEWDPWRGTSDTRGDAAVNSPNFHPLYRDYVIGLLSLRLKEVQAANSALESLFAQSDSAAEMTVAQLLARHLEAHLARQDNRNADAIRLFLQSSVELENLPINELFVSPFVWHAYERFVLAELLLEEGRLEDALKWHRILLEETSWLTLPYVPLTHLGLGRIYESLGEPKQAAHHYARFIEGWRDSDPALQPVVAEARLRIQQILKKDAAP